MRALLSALFLAGLPAAAARAESCDGLIARVIHETGARTDERSSDYASFTAGPDTTLTLACGLPDPSSVGAQFRGSSPPEAYYALFGRAGHAVTGIEAAALAQAARRAQEAATARRHSNVEVGGALVTCSAMVSPDKGPLTLCAVIEHASRS